MPDLYAVIGHPINHSKSPFLHSEFARQTELSIQYEALLAPLDGFEATAYKFHQNGGKGLNVTVPFKLQACQFATQLTKRAELAQAVNTLQFNEDQILGDNTDGLGLIQDILINLNFPIENKRILLMGAGGAARGAMLPLLNANPAMLFIANRTEHKAHTLRQQFSAHGNIDSGNYTELAGKSFDIVINATSASLQNTLPPLPPGIFSSGSLAYDMMYSKELTPLLKFAQQNGVKYLADGIGMLVEQAAESFYIWHGIRPETKQVIDMLKQRS